MLGLLFTWEYPILMQSFIDLLLLEIRINLIGRQYKKEDILRLAYCFSVRR